MPFIGGDEYLGRTFQIMVESNNSQFKHDPRALSRVLADSAKRWWGVAIGLKLGGFIIGCLVILFSLIPLQAPFIIAVLSIGSELSIWYSDRIRATAEALRRKLDFSDSFGWSVSKAEMSDLLLQVPRHLRNTMPAQGTDDPYFSSKASRGIERALDNLQESAWWSKHLAMSMGHICLAMTCIAVFGSIAILVISIETIRDFDVLASIGRVVTSALVLVFSLSLIRLTYGYYNFHIKASRSEDIARGLLEAKSAEQVQIIKQMYEYQIARAAAPLIPTWLWHARRAELNELWNEYRVES